MTFSDQIALAWLCAASAAAFLLFGGDKLRSRRSGRRVPESRLVLLGMLGGWPGGLLGMLVFRHKTAKATFLIRYAAGLVPFAGLCAAYWKFR